VRDQLEQLTQSSDRALAKLEGASDTVQARADRMTDAAKTATEATVYADKAMQATLRSTSGAAEQNLLKLREIGEALRQHTQNVSQASDHLSSKMGGAGEQLRNQLHEISSSFDEALRGIDAVGTSVEQHARSAADESNRALQSMSLWGKTMEQGAKNMTSASAKVSQDTEKMTSEVRRQTRELDAVSQNATKITSSLKEFSRQASSQNFLQRLSMISEALESVAIDINRVMETRITENDWVHYNRGDKSIFLRKILGMRSRSKLSKIKQLHRENSEFREYVTRYLRQFDVLISDAKRSDQDAVLGSSVMTSDAGKVYLVLRAALDADPKETPA
ncbi:MAG: hypothetical protein P8J29_10695, partial [Rhodospirillales bacterium]|nr:hypothetical protein [Rhodospirillales bacterium]